MTGNMPHYGSALLPGARLPWQEPRNAYAEGDVPLTINIASDSIAQRKFRVLLASWKKKRLLGRSMVDTLHLERLQQLVSTHLMHWSGKVEVEQVNDEAV
jgi:hypothetical protein